MPGICRDNDTAGGDLVPSQSTVFANSEEVIIDGDTVVAHGPAPHLQQTIIAGSDRGFVTGEAVCNAGDVASVCGEAATGSTDVFAG